MISFIRKEKFYQILGEHPEYNRYNCSSFIGDLDKTSSYPYYQLDSGELFVYLKDCIKILVPKQYDIIDKIKTEINNFTISNWKFSKINDQVPYLYSEFQKTINKTLFNISTYRFNNRGVEDDDYAKKVENLKKTFTDGTYEFYDEWSGDIFQACIKIFDASWALEVYACYPEKQRRPFNSTYLINTDRLIGTILKNSIDVCK